MPPQNIGDAQSLAVRGCGLGAVPRPPTPNPYYLSSHMKSNFPQGWMPGPGLKFFTSFQAPVM